MSEAPRLRKRRPVRRKNVQHLLGDLERSLGINLEVGQAFLEMAEYGSWTMVLVDRVPHVIELLDEGEERMVFLTLRGLMHHAPDRGWIDVDHGAIPFLMNGADCMSAGIHATSPTVKQGDLVWIRDQEHHRPLAVGWAMEDGAALVQSTKGKGVRTIHWVGDELWDLDS